MTDPVAEVLTEKTMLMGDILEQQAKVIGLHEARIRKLELELALLVKGGRLCEC